MGRPRSGKTGRKQKGKPASDIIAGIPLADLDDDIDKFHKGRDKIPLDIKDDFELSEDEMEEPVFNFKADSSEESADMESDDEDLDEEQLSGLAAKMAKQAKILRQKTSLMEDEEDEEEDDKNSKKAAWGKRKKMYYSADNVDYELQFSDEEAPAEEEAEVLRLQRLKAESLRPEDFELDEEDDEVGAQLEGHERTLQEVVERTEAKGQQEKVHGASKRHIVSGLGEDRTISVEEVKKDLNALSKDEQMEVVMSDAPELVGLLAELREGLDELQNKIEPLLKKIKGGHYATKEGIGYLETKHALLLCYCQSIVFYLLMKAEGRSVRDHPVIARLVEIRMLLEKLRPIDKKLQHQIEKLMNLVKGPSLAATSKDSLEKDDTLKYKPNSDLFVSKVNQVAGESGGLYCPPMVVPSHMVGEKDAKDIKLKSQTEDAKQQASRSGYVKELGNEQIKEMIGTESKEMLRERARLEACVQEEENLFTGVPLSKAERQKLKHRKRSRNGLMGMLDDYDDDVADLVGLEKDKPAGKPKIDLLRPRKLSQIIDEAGKQSKKPKIVSGDADLPVKEDLGERRSKHEMQKVSKPQRFEGEEDSGEELGDVQLEEDEFYQEAKQLKAAKQAVKALKYSRTATIPAQAEEATGKRHISYQMEKNRGLTPHRKKLTKNPRKKYKVKHQKAVIRRKGQVREVKLPAGSYGGEATGIRTNISRSVRFQS